MNIKKINAVMNVNSKIKTTNSVKIFNVIGSLYTLLISVFCLIPFWLVISGSLSDNADIVKYGYSLIPRNFTLDAYKTVFLFPEQILRAYGVTISVTIIGTITGLFMITAGGYVLNRKDFKYRNQISFFIYFTTLFSGGLIPWYILMVKYLHLRNSYMVLIIPILMSPFLIILMKNFMKSIPDEIVESAKIDGAGDFKIYKDLIIPLAKPGLATIGLFLALAYWNDWYLSSIFITDREKYSLQFLLYNILSSAQFLRSGIGSNVPVQYEIPTETIKLATAAVVTGPVILFYPFAQKYFVKGLTIGAVKG